MESIIAMNYHVSFLGLPSFSLKRAPPTRSFAKSRVIRACASYNHQRRLQSIIVDSNFKGIRASLISNCTDSAEANESFPIPIDEDKLRGIYHCGFHSYLILHPEGNILVDTPNYTEGLAQRIEKSGVLRFIVIITHNHNNDVVNHRKWSKRLKCDRVLHSQDVKASTDDVEIKLRGRGPWSLNSDATLIHTPSHTEGAVCLFHKFLKVIFTGDHLAVTPLAELNISNPFSNSVPMQLKSAEKLLKLDFKWIISAYGRRFEFKDFEEKNSMIQDFLQTKYS